MPTANAEGLDPSGGRPLDPVSARRGSFLPANRPTDPVGDRRRHAPRYFPKKNRRSAEHVCGVLLRSVNDRTLNMLLYALNVPHISATSHRLVSGQCGLTVPVGHVD